jgi:hypothetical protein
MTNTAFNSSFQILEASAQHDRKWIRWKHVSRRPSSTLSKSRNTVLSADIRLSKVADGSRKPNPPAREIREFSKQLADLTDYKLINES